MSIPKPDITENEIRFRIQSPGNYDRKSFRYKEITRGIKFVVACPKGAFKRGMCSVGMQTQSVRFDRDYFTVAEARKWLSGRIDKLIRKSNPYPLLIATLGNPAREVIDKYLGKYPELKKDFEKAIRLFKRIHGDEAVLNPVVIEDGESRPHIEVAHGIIKNTTYDTGIVKGSRLSDAVYYHPAGDKKHSMINRPGLGTLSPDARVHRIRYNKGIINPEGMMDG